MFEKHVTGIELIVKNFEIVLERTSLILKKQIETLIAKGYKIREYEDKNSHITGEIFRVGSFLVGMKYYGLAERYWDNITTKTKEFSNKIDIKFNCGMSLANTGVSQLSSGKSVEGLNNFYLAYEDDKRILEENNIKNIDVERELLNSPLFTQFFNKILDFYFDEIILEVPGPLSINQSDFFDIPKKIKSLTAIQLFFVLSELKTSIELFKISNNFISRSRIMISLFGLCHWIENTLKEIYKSGNLSVLLQKAFNKNNKELNFKTTFIHNYKSSTLEELKNRIDSNLKNEEDYDIANARLLRLIRNYSGHNISVQNHNFFSEIKEYVTRILNLLVKYTKND